MYLKHFRLSEPPFSLTPDPNFFYMSDRHREGLAHLIYGIQQPGGFVLLTGEVGSGKTTICRCLIKELPPDTEIALILNPRLTALELLAAVCDELRAPYPPETASIKVLIDALNRRLLENHAHRKRTAIIIDEAQNLSGDVLEQIRLLTNLETAREKLLQIILIGQPELLSVLERKELRQLAQRITARYHLMPMSRNETGAYIRHRLLVAGRSDSIFTPTAIRRVYRLSGGVPRIINIICDRALLGAYARDKRDVTAAIVNRACRETKGVRPQRIHFAWMVGIVVIAALAIGAAFFLRTGLPGLRESASSKAKAPSAALESVSPAHLDDMDKNAGADSKKSAGGTSESDVHSPQDASSALRLLDILAASSPDTTTASGFVALYAAWGADVSIGPSDFGCQAGHDRGFVCLFQSGGWSRLRRFNLPAMLEMRLPDGRRKYATIVGLSDEAASFAIGKAEYSFPLSEVDELWSGSFILLWKPPFTLRQLSLGKHGKDVAWVRQALRSVDGEEAGGDQPELFDGNLRKRVIDFQRSQGLLQDGIVGKETLVRLASLYEGSNAPSLVRPNR